MQASAVLSANPRPFTERNAALIPVWLLLTFNIYWVFWLYKTYREVRQHSPHVTTITPGSAVGFLFIPFFNVFWFFRLVIDLPRALARVQAQCAPQAQPLPSAQLSSMLAGGMFFNVLGAYIHPGMFVAGEILLASAFVVLQSRMNAHNRLHQGAPAATAQPRETFAELIGATVPAFDWPRVAVFAAATLAGYLVINLGTRMAFGGNMGLDWRWAVTATAWAVLATAGAVVGFRYLRNEWLAAAAGAAVFAVGMNVIWALLQNGRPSVSGVAGNFLAQFVALAALAVVLHVARPLWLAILLGALVGEFGDSALALLWSGETWYSSFFAWMNAPPDPGSSAFIGARLGMIQPVLDLFSACALAGVLWGGRVLLPRGGE